MDKKRLFPIILILMTVLSIYYMIDSRHSSDTAYQGYLKAAREAAEERILVDAENNYFKALEMRPSLELSIEIGEMYLSLEEYSDAAYWYDRRIKDVYPQEEAAYEFGIKAAIVRGKKEKAFEIYDLMKDRKLFSEKAEELISEIRYSFSLSEHYEDVGAFSNLSGLAAVKSDDRWGYIARDGGWRISNVYLEAGIMGNTAPVVAEDGEAFFIDVNGNRKVNTSKYEEDDPAFGEIKSFIGEEGGFVVASNGEEVAFFEADSGKKAFGNFQSATIMSNGVFGASKDGEYWALINQEGNEITEYRYQAVLTDKKGNPCRNNAVFVKENGKYLLLDRHGTPITGQEYEDAEAFNDNTLAAVKKNGKWLFVNDAGEETDLGSYQRAKSFSNGLAAVEQGNLWGYIDMEGNIVVEPQFMDADAISPMGVGFVRTDTNVWKLLSFYSQNHK